MQCGDVESNPGPIATKFKQLSICHWNLNSISAHKLIKLSLLEAYIHTEDRDVIFFVRNLFKQLS